jgi:hypothetical protein
MALWWKFEGPNPSDHITKNIHGAQVNVLPSPYDIPESFRTYIDPGKNRWTVEFKYIDSEPLMLWQPSETLRLWLGRNSRRVYKIDARDGNIVSENPAARAQIVRCLDDALRQLGQNTKLGTAAANYEFLREGIPRTSIFGPVPTP